VWLAESKRLEREWSEQSRRVQALAAKVDGLFAEVNQAARDRDNWQHEAQRIAREWEAVAEQLQVARSHGDAMAAHARGLERERDDVVGRVTELVAENEVQQAELTKLLARLQTAHLSAAHFRALFEAIRGEADGLEARRAFRLARTLGLVDPIYTGKSAATLDGANGSIGGHA
jgi:chromosome segregation ATPase